MEDDLTMQQEEFEYWLAEMDDALERFLTMFALKVRPRLDYSEESLDYSKGGPPTIGYWHHGFPSLVPLAPTFLDFLDMLYEDPSDDLLDTMM